MKKLFLVSSLLFAAISITLGQETFINLSFTAVTDSIWTQMDSIKIRNLTQDCDTILYWADTSLLLNSSVGFHEIHNKPANLSLKCYPNPSIEKTKIELKVDEPGQGIFTLTDVSGRILFTMDRYLQAGNHRFQFVPGNSYLYFASVSLNRDIETLKIVNLNPGNNYTGAVSYMGYDVVQTEEKSTTASTGFWFSSGDELLFIGYADTLESGILDSPDDSRSYTFQFAYNIPCPNISTVDYEGQIYHTVQIFSQCWLKENINAGVMINGTMEMDDNGILEKYCYNNDTSWCNQFGGLYQWDEMMNYTCQQGGQGICPAGWHLPTDNEWKVLEGAVDSQYGIGDQIWSVYGLRGYDAGTHLKSVSGWASNGNGSGVYGFSGMSGGYRYNNGLFYYKSLHGLWWSSTDGNATSAWNRYFSYNNPIVDRDYGNNKRFGFSVRCIKD